MKLEQFVGKEVLIQFAEPQKWFAIINQGGKPWFLEVETEGKNEAGETVKGSTVAPMPFFKGKLIEYNPPMLVLEYDDEVSGGLMYAAINVGQIVSMGAAPEKKLVELAGPGG